MALDLIYDRTQADADRWLLLVDKIDTGGWASLTAEEQAEWLTQLKGSYNYTDLKRVSKAVDYLAGRFLTLITHLNEYRDGYQVADDARFRLPYTEDDVVVEPQLSWSRSTQVYDAMMTQYLSDLRVIRSLLPLPQDTPEVPPDMESLTVDEANDIEKMLDMVDDEITSVTDYKETLIRDTAAAWFYSGDLFSAEV